MSVHYSYDSQTRSFLYPLGTATLCECRIERNHTSEEPVPYPPRMPTFAERPLIPRPAPPVLASSDGWCAPAETLYDPVTNSTILCNHEGCRDEALEYMLKCARHLPAGVYYSKGVVSPQGHKGWCEISLHESTHCTCDSMTGRRRPYEPVLHSASPFTTSEPREEDSMSYKDRRQNELMAMMMRLQGQIAALDKFPDTDEYEAGTVLKITVQTRGSMLTYILLKVDHDGAARWYHTGSFTRTMTKPDGYFSSWEQVMIWLAQTNVESFEEMVPKNAALAIAEPPSTVPTFNLGALGQSSGYTPPVVPRPTQDEEPPF